MEIIKKAITAIALTLVVFLLTLTSCYLFISDSTLVPLLSAYIESASGTRITYDKDATINRTLSPTLHLSNLSIADNNKDFYVHLSSLNVQVSLPGLLFGKMIVPSLIAGETNIKINQSNSPGDITLPKKLPFAPVFHKIELAKIVINNGADDLILPATQLNEFSIILDPKTQNLTITLAAYLADKKILLNAKLPQLQQSLLNRQMPFTISTTNSNIVFSAKGNINLQPSAPEITAILDLQIPDTQPIFSDLIDFKIQGSLTGKAKIDGTFAQLAAQDIALVWKGEDDKSSASLSGDIKNLSQLSACNLQINSHFENNTWLAPLLPDSLGGLKNAELKAQLTCQDKQLAVEDVRLQLDTIEGLDLALDGQFNLTKQGQNSVSPTDIDLNLQFSAPTTRTARLLFFENIWEFGAISGTANIRSTDGAPAVEDIAIKAIDPQGIEVILGGRIDQFPLNPEISNTGYDIDVTMQATATNLMAERFGIGDVPLTGPVKINYRIEGDSQALQLNDITLTSGKEEEILLSATGNLHFGNWDQEDPLENIDLAVRATSYDSQALEALFKGKKIPDIGGLTAQAKVQTLSNKHRIDDFLLKTSEDSELQISISGSAEQVLFFDQPGINGIQLELAANATDNADLNKIFGLQKTIPALGAIKLTANIYGKDNELTIGSVSINAGAEDNFFIKLQGEVGSFSASNDWLPTGTDLNISSKFTTSKSLTNLFDLQLPELGSVSAKAKLIDKDHKLMLQSANITVGDPDKPTLNIKGHINDIMAFKEIDMGISLNLDGHSFAALSSNIDLPDLQPLTGETIISDNDGTLGIDTFHLTSKDETLLTIEANGVFDDFANPDTLSFSTRITAQDLLLIGALFNQQWPAIGPVQIDSTIQKKEQNLLFDTNITAGEMKINSEINGSFISQPPKINGKISADNFFIPKLHNKMAKETSSTNNYFFSREIIDLSWFKKADLDLAIDIDSFEPDWSQAKSANFAVSLQSGNFLVSPATISWKKGEVTFDINLDTNNTPTFKLEAHTKGLDPWQTIYMKDSKVGQEFKAEMNLDANMSSSGVSAHELAANLTGDVYVNLQNGKIRRSLIDLIFLDFVGWTVSKVSTNKYTDVQCGVADYSIKDGIINTNAFLLDTKNIIITGEGSIDLKSETIDYVFLPKKKSALIKKASPVKIKGSMGNPQIKTIPWKTAATTYGSLLFAPYLFVGSWATDFLSENVKIGKETNPCQEYTRTVTNAKDVTNGEK